MEYQEMSLINKIRSAVKSGKIKEPFSTQDIEKWVRGNNIKKPNGKPYAKSSVRSILSNSDKKNMPTSNKNKKCLTSRKINGKRNYKIKNMF